MLSTPMLCPLLIQNKFWALLTIYTSKQFTNSYCAVSKWGTCKHIHTQAGRQSNRDRGTKILHFVDRYTHKFCCLDDAWWGYHCHHYCRYPSPEGQGGRTLLQVFNLHVAGSEKSAAAGGGCRHLVGGYSLSNQKKMVASPDWAASAVYKF